MDKIALKAIADALDERILEAAVEKALLTFELARTSEWIGGRRLSGNCP